ncbi:hypothetical protein ACLRGF_00295 [Mycetocola zhadangensis]|uniref:hypothetical protein n=1 Tax=Mycetocola zhadangensis TaxID=1164595 RepID=UPI003A4D6B67
MDEIPLGRAKQEAQCEGHIHPVRFDHSEGRQTRPEAKKPGDQAYRMRDNPRLVRRIEARHGQEPHDSIAEEMPLPHTQTTVI